MPIVHIYPDDEVKLHKFNGGANCFCEPEIITLKMNKDARIFIHQRLKRVKATFPGMAIPGMYVPRRVRT